MSELPRELSFIWVENSTKKFLSGKSYLRSEKEARRRMADKNKSGDFYNRPEKLGAWDGFKQFLWNPDTSQFMGRTGSSWGKS